MWLMLRRRITINSNFVMVNISSLVGFYLLDFLLRQQSKSSLWLIILLLQQYNTRDIENRDLRSRKYTQNNLFKRKNFFADSFSWFLLFGSLVHNGMQDDIFEISIIGPSLSNTKIPITL